MKTLTDSMVEKAFVNRQNVRNEYWHMLLVAHALTLELCKVFYNERARLTIVSY